ncbi:cupin domain-containing protein [Corynebacterium uropygiale]|uniref:Acireductone dioxygenase n=1 Tax=Corynebacterium uropygiale TaxID=1775911 RepID=A0A9X1QNY8_9CORY|nr:cupin domain-containing protein [Corynebacterium uropygiale]MCF4006151.1 cupin domain-containing protein [Corynebacterium uropygiale]
MTLLVMWKDSDPTTETLRTTQPETIAEVLGRIGAQYEQWDSSKDLAPDADQAAVLEAYAAEVRDIREREGYDTIDVMRLHNYGQPDFWEQAAAGRKKFLDEHTHSDDEVRYFVEGSGTFYLHVGDDVYAVVCEKGDYLSVPEGATHWFDMGEKNPSFCAIRFFHDEEGWVGEFTGEPIARRFPTHDELAASLPGSSRQDA